MGESEKKPAPSGETQPYKKKWHSNHNKKKHHDNKTTPTARPEKFHGGKDELDGNHFDCTGYGQSDRYMRTIEKIAGFVGQDYRHGGITRTEVMTQKAMVIDMPLRPKAKSTKDKAGVVTLVQPDAMDISDYQSEKKLKDSEVHHQQQNRQKLFSLVWQQCTEPMHAKIRAHREYLGIELTLDGVELLRVIMLDSYH